MDRMYFQAPILICLGLLLCGGIGIVKSESDYILDSLKGCKVPFDNGTKDGLCINFEHDVIRCPSLKNMLLDRNFSDIYSAVCGEPDAVKLNETKVCCPVEEYIEQYPTITDEFEKHRNFKLIPNPESSKCGEAFGSYTDRIIGGIAAPPGTQPWMARLGLVMSDEDDKVRFLCSGSIINERNILTAGTESINLMQPIFLENLLLLQESSLTSDFCEVSICSTGYRRTIRLAEYDEDVAKECIETVAGDICQEVEDHVPESILIHENYTGEIGSINDIALIRLKEPIRNLTSLFTRPVCLPFIDEFELPDLENVAVSSTGSKNALSIQGWGKENNEDNEGSKQLKQVNVPLRSNVYCRHFFLKANLTVTDEQICVGGAKDKGSCAGDSGSPLILSSHSLKKNMGMRMFQVGIVSYGRQRCGVKDSPVVYTRVRSFLKWILDNIQE